MKFSVLASGSRANATVIVGSRSVILIDIGLSARQTEKRLAQLGIAARDVAAILVTHEHSDHIAGLESFSRSFKVPVYGTCETLKTLRYLPMAHVISPLIEFQVEEFVFEAIPLSHDAVDPVGYCCNDQTNCLVQLTDLGCVTDEVRKAVRRADSLIIESNHDEDMLWGSHYPWSLKKRIASDRGHLSNKTAAELVASESANKLKTVVLAHMSENTNTPDLAFSMMQQYLQSVRGAEAMPELHCGGARAATPYL